MSNPPPKYPKIKVGDIGIIHEMSIDTSIQDVSECNAPQKVEKPPEVELGNVIEQKRCGYVIYDFM